MSQYPPALTYTLNFEDPKREYAPVPDVGGFAIAGVNSNSWPASYKEIAEASLSERPQLIYDFYQNNFWNPMKVGSLDYQDLANRVLDEGINASAEVSIKLLQKSINLLGENLAIDGILGPNTREAANNKELESLLAAFRQTRLSYYKEIVDKNPSFVKYLNNWEVRALA